MTSDRTDRLRVAVTNQIGDSVRLKQSLLADTETLDQLIELALACAKSLVLGGKIVFAGNGGSFADAQHLSAELVSRLHNEREPLASIVLGANSSTITAIANDYGYEQSFARELEGLCKEGDVFIPLSTSGNSANIVKAVLYAKQANIYCIGFCGMTENTLSQEVECIKVNSNVTTRIQEVHIMLGHILIGLIESLLLESRSEK